MRLFITQRRRRWQSIALMLAHIVRSPPCDAFLTTPPRLHNTQLLSSVSSSSTGKAVLEDLTDDVTRRDQKAGWIGWLVTGKPRGTSPAKSTCAKPSNLEASLGATDTLAKTGFIIQSLYQRLGFSRTFEVQLCVSHHGECFCHSSIANYSYQILQLPHDYIFLRLHTHS
jgi:hypothetical protein